MTLTWVLMAVGAADLAHGLSGRLDARLRWRGVAVAALVTLLLAGLLGSTATAAGRVGVFAVVVVGVWHGLRIWGQHALAVAWMGAAAAVALLVGDRGDLVARDNTWDDLWSDVDLAALASFGPDEVLRLIAVGLYLLVTANAIVRLILDLEGAQRLDAVGSEASIKGGRIIGPIERLIIFGAVVGGAAATAGLVVAAKSLLRFPELSGDGEDLHTKTEYVLVGSLASWALALAGAVLV